MKTTHVKLEFQKEHAIFGVEKSNEYKPKYIYSDNLALGRK
jgi:hypothetical protein